VIGAETEKLVYVDGDIQDVDSTETLMYVERNDQLFLTRSMLVAEQE